MSDNGQQVPLPGCMIGPSEPCDAFQRQTARIAELEAALAAERERREAAETDAGRYRWLREWRARWEIRYWGGMFWDSFNADKLDAAIDKEAAKSPGTEPMQSKLVED